MTITKMYMSRENRVSDVKPLDCGEDLKRAGSVISHCLDNLSQALDAMEEANEEYFDACFDYSVENSEETEAGIQVAAFALEDKWADVQMELSKYAVLMSIDGNEAFNRKVG